VTEDDEDDDDVLHECETWSITVNGKGVQEENAG
jgi:hypothetical protein